MVVKLNFLFVFWKNWRYQTDISKINWPLVTKPSCSLSAQTFFSQSSPAHSPELIFHFINMTHLSPSYLWFSLLRKTHSLTTILWIITTESYFLFLFLEWILNLAPIINFSNLINYGLRELQCELDLWKNTKCQVQNFA